MKNTKNNFIWLGTIVNTHGIKGEIRILSNLDNLKDRFKPNNTIYYELNEEIKELVINSFRLHKNFVLVTLKEMSNINAVEFLKEKKVYAKKTGKEKYVSDLIGYSVMDSKLGNIGTITKIIDIGSYDSLIVNFNGKEYNIPYVYKFVLSENDKSQTIQVEIPKEFIE